MYMSLRKNLHKLLQDILSFVVVNIFWWRGSIVHCGGYPSQYNSILSGGVTRPIQPLMFLVQKSVLNHKIWRLLLFLLRKTSEKYPLLWFNKWSKEAEYNLLKFSSKKLVGPSYKNNTSAHLSKSPLNLTMIGRKNIDIKNFKNQIVQIHFCNLRLWNKIFLTNLIISVISSDSSF